MERSRIMSTSMRLYAAEEEEMGQMLLQERRAAINRRIGAVSQLFKHGRPCMSKIRQGFSASEPLNS